MGMGVAVGVGVAVGGWWVGACVSRPSDAHNALVGRQRGLRQQAPRRHLGMSYKCVIYTL